MTSDDNKRFLRLLLASSKGALFLNSAQAGCREQDAIQAVACAITPCGLTSLTMDIRQFGNTGDYFTALENIPPEVAVAHFTGCSEWIRNKVYSDDPSSTLQFIHRINLFRESMFQIPVKKIWWLDDEAIGFLAREATDLWSWRAGVFVIDPDKSFHCRSSPPAPSA
ncbi:MAG: hypothetical protein HYS17_10030 [Micavibrio aeruginosavorus]|uniref:Uncharacterized protein n=1 Tax=Micavibrio aeruginosavorus TaxID=349221 RepID=A0A7T5R1S5_9BACT|nr:MAG: hypothetical protein HYS17_10030 [Micavibrio aeruginosavorus]